MNGSSISLKANSKVERPNWQISARSRRFPAAFWLLPLAVLTVGASNPLEVAPVRAAKKNSYLAPTAIVASADGGKLYVACEATAEVRIFDASAKKASVRIPVAPAPSGLALSADGTRLYVTCAAPVSTICIVDTSKRKVIQRLPAGYQAQSPVLSPDGRMLYVCNRFDNDVSIIDLTTGKELRRIAVPREPFSATVTPDGRLLLVANHLHAGRADADVVAASVSVIDLAAGKVSKEIQLPNGSILLHEIRVAPDGRHAVVAHDLARFHLPTTQIERGWINTSAGSIIDLTELKLLNTVLFDTIDSGAANPWAVGWTRDSKQLLVTHAGTHEVSVVDFPALLEKLAKLPAVLDPGRPVDYMAASRTVADVPNDLSFLVGIRERVKLPGKGPRSLAVAGNHLWVANYFSDTIDAVDLAASPLRSESMALGAAPKMTTVRLGEFYFNDASICFQGWQTCASCHSHDARVDGLNWDNLNDGIGNPKNGKSLLKCFETPPEMWLGVRSNAPLAVRMGIRNSLFTVQPSAVGMSMDDYLKALKPMPSPRLVKGRLTPAAERGKKLFFDTTVACADCHGGPLFTDLKFHSVGTIGKFDQPTDAFDTPSLIEVWRTGPYLHDGRAVSIREVLTKFQHDDEHGVTSHLTPQQMDDLVEYVMSL